MVILKVHKAGPNALHWVLYCPHCCRCDLALLFPSLVSSGVRICEVAVWQLSFCFHSPSTDPPTDTSTDPSTDPPTELCDCSRCCSFSSCCDDCYCYYSEYSGSALQNAFKIQVSVTPHQHTLFIHAQQSVAELWLVLCIYCVRCACMVVKCALFICLLCAGLIYHSHTRWYTSENTQTQQAWLLRDCIGCGI